MKIGRLGAWYAFDKLSGAQIPPLLALLERLNYDVVWYPESRGYESLSLAGFLLATVRSLRSGARSPASTRVTHLPLAAACCR
jgi:hypothetical protein